MIISHEKRAQSIVLLVCSFFYLFTFIFIIIIISASDRKMVELPGNGRFFTRPVCAARSIYKTFTLSLKRIKFFFFQIELDLRLKQESIIYLTLLGSVLFVSIRGWCKSIREALSRVVHRHQLQYYALQLLQLQLQCVISYRIVSPFQYAAAHCVKAFQILVFILKRDFSRLFNPCRLLCRQKQKKERSLETNLGKVK